MIPREAGSTVLCNSRDRGGLSRACQVGCIGCRACVQACPEEAITMEENLAMVIWIDVTIVANVCLNAVPVYYPRKERRPGRGDRDEPLVLKAG